MLWTQMASFLVSMLMQSSMHSMMPKLRNSTEATLRNRKPKPQMVASLPTPSMVMFIF